MKGLCDICGCTDSQACAVPGGCGWVNPEQTLCSACVGWAKLKSGQQFAGVFDHNLVPVTAMFPREGVCKPLGRDDLFLDVDHRRLDPDTLLRLACVSAPQSGMTVDEFVSLVGSGKEFCGLRFSLVDAMVAARDLDRAVLVFDLVELGGTPTPEICFGETPLPARRSS